MKQEQHEMSDLVDLGPVTKVTRGAWGEFSDEILMQHMPGLSND